MAVLDEVHVAQNAQRFWDNDMHQATTQSATRESIFDMARFRRVIRKIGSRAAGSSHAGVTILRGIPGGAVRRGASLIHHILVISERLDGAVTLGREIAGAALPIRMTKRGMP
ncbi:MULTISPECIES: hypothetical protein [unclassified Mesorhizobium]|uniref:hypothetical protein n=1 Tax=unclassified Mesorhizobium TaxID=325217 RepID=UPI000F7609FA|nr:MULTISPECIES: hypothetical protein [unclassified Mesorhizobium]RVC96378.1 hypothetical protein EN753_31240 [Mesorhizobium sp. M2A.F.Ca.ET.029.05.1.1]AZO02299.1 hypothetical protein EJ068_03865 [Mesorhizobium sp. M2A.F.Ca.ET.043.02.1.1]RUW37492.1 hypothetical protein EOA37_25305 [Mesorhizobium sp. M2A.F.Ca.ET.015.02.1.1]RUW67028.1 hypothetical protein EOA28_29790 [Mesorhizobium sp. M2A.F.Ca.ET.067.02.1.1]RVC94705.1 hypothetical protein EN739_16100 [Mesorhizobium sp. M2A.F.Ca.ET.017.03.2.1]